MLELHLQVAHGVGDVRQHALVCDVGVVVALAVVQNLPHLVDALLAVEFLVRVVRALLDPRGDFETLPELVLQVVNRVRNPLLGLDLLDGDIQVVERLDLRNTTTKTHTTSSRSF